MRKMTNSAGLTGAMPITQIKPPVVDVCLGHGGVVASHEEGLIFRCALQDAVAPQTGEKIADAAHHAPPGRVGVDVEYHPLCASLDRRFDEDKDPADVDVFPVGIAAGGSPAPDQVSGAREIAQAIHALGIENRLLPLLIGNCNCTIPLITSLAGSFCTPTLVSLRA